MPTYHIKDRNRPIPNGHGVYDPGTGYRARPFASFEEQVNGVLQARIGNPGMTQRYRLSIDRADVENFVSTFLGKVAFDNGWTDYYVTADGGSGGAAPPFSRSLGERLVGAAKAAGLSVEWIASGAEAVPIELANKRAETCSKCPLNENGDWLSTFTVPVAGAIRRALEARNGMKLETKFDDKIGVCTACDCVCRLKVHMGIQKIVSKMPADVKGALHPDCWILGESK